MLKMARVPREGGKKFFGDGGDVLVGEGYAKDGKPKVSTRQSLASTAVALKPGVQLMPE